MAALSLAASLFSILRDDALTPLFTILTYLTHARHGGASEKAVGLCVFKITLEHQFGGHNHLLGPVYDVSMVLSRFHIELART